MSFLKIWAAKQDDRKEQTEMSGKAVEDVELEAALKNFRECVTAWSDAELSRPRTHVELVRHRSWRLAAGWALACALLAGGVSGGLYGHHQKLEKARIALIERQAEQQRLIAQERARAEEEDLLAKVDSDVSREVPSAMEPLAQLMNGDEIK
jgi:hypothetical protein